MVKLFSPKANENVHHEHQIDNQIDDDKRIGSTLLVLEYARRCVLIQLGSFLAFVQQKRNGKRCKDRCVNDEQKNDPIPNGFEWRVMQNDELLTKLFHQVFSAISNARVFAHIIFGIVLQEKKGNKSLKHVS
jgi:hypothetical protein